MALTLVVKLGGEVVRSRDVDVIAADIAALTGLGHRITVVHGGGPQVTELQAKLGQTPRIVGGRRVTDKPALYALKMAIAGEVNIDLCAALLRAGVRPVGLHGASGLVLKARKRAPMVVTGGGPEPVDLGFVGDVTHVDVALLELLARSSYVPVLACLGADEAGEIYNINADKVANAVAVALRADALVLVTDVPAVLADRRDPASRFATLTVREGREAIRRGVVEGGMIPKLEESFAGIDAGIRAVHVVGRLARGDLLRAVVTPGSVGTVVVADSA